MLNAKVGGSPLTRRLFFILSNRVKCCQNHYGYHINHRDCIGACARTHHHFEPLIREFKLRAIIK